MKHVLVALDSVEAAKWAQVQFLKVQTSGTRKEPHDTCTTLAAKWANTMVCQKYKCHDPVVLTAKTQMHVSQSTPSTIEATRMCLICRVNARMSDAERARQTRDSLADALGVSSQMPSRC